MLRATGDVLRGGGARAAGLAALVMVAACGDPPTKPAPIVNPPPVQPVNQAPVIESISLSGDRAEVDADVTVTAVVLDAETAVDQLKFEWRADAGTFSGEGRIVRWRAAKGSLATTPADLTLRLTVTEVYGFPDAAGVRPQHVVTSTSPALRLHDSPAEVSELATTFLRDFSNSSVDPEVTVRDFADSSDCGKAAELEDVRKNREHYRITGSKHPITGISINAQRTRADVTASCEFTSQVIKCHPEIPNCAVGMTTVAVGICALEARYEQRRWWLCESRFLAPNGLVPYGLMR